MKKFITKIIEFTAFAFVIYITTLFIFGKFLPDLFKPNLNYRIGSYGHMYTRMKDIEKYKDIDILFLGSSHSYRGFDTRIFDSLGYRSFNLGSSSQSAIQTKVLLNRYLDKLNPKTIIYEVNPQTFTFDGVESAVDLISNDNNDLHSIKMAFKLNSIKVYNTLLYGLIADKLEMNKFFIEPNVRYDEYLDFTDIYFNGGYVQKITKQYKLNIYDKWEIDLTKMIRLNDFEKNIKHIRDKNIDLILVFAPITYDFYSKCKNIEQFNDMMMSYSEYHNFNDILKLNDTLHFYDQFHLNQQGVSIFNKKLIKTLGL